MKELWNSLKDISFDESDKNLFQVDDPRLRADAIRFSILPRIHNVFNTSISAIFKVYGTDVYEDSIASYFPHFRTKRDNELEYMYDTAYVGLGGKRSKKPKWHGLKRKDNKPVQIIPVRFGFRLDIDGIYLLFENWGVKGLTDDSYKKYFQFNIDHEPLIQRLCHSSYMSPLAAHGDSCKPVSTYKQHYDFIIQNKFYDMQFFASNIFPYPITSGHHFYSLDNIVDAFINFYPVYDSYIQISKGEEVRFENLIKKLNSWLIQKYEKEELNEGKQKNSNQLSDDDLLKVRELAGKNVKVMPAMRWQVFQRDNWKCVSCGRSAANDVILHVDHIIPRSKGGKDELDNFQTLCHLCNIGKSNKDETNIREFHKN
jgi:hypothetical protein